MSEDLLTHVKQYYETKVSEKLNDEVDVDEVLSLYSFLTYDKPKLLEGALEVIDKQPNHKIIEVTCQSMKRSFFVVNGSQGRQYLVLTGYCPCQSYSNLFNHQTRDNHCPSGVFQDHKVVYCKHLLAVSVATALNKIEKQVLSDVEFMEMFKSVELRHN